MEKETLFMQKILLVNCNSLLEVIKLKQEG